MIQLSVLPVRNLRFFAGISVNIFPALRPETVVETLDSANDDDLTLPLSLSRYTDLLCVSRNVGMDFVHYYVVYRRSWCFACSPERYHCDMDVEHLSIDLWVTT